MFNFLRVKISAGDWLNFFLHFNFSIFLHLKEMKPPCANQAKVNEFYVQPSNFLAMTSKYAKLHYSEARPMPDMLPSILHVRPALDIHAW